MLSIETLVVGDLSTNCYLVTDSATGETIIIDPGDDADFITDTILSKKLKPTAIILTHGHFDHVLGSLELKLNFDIPILLHQNDLKLYTLANQSAKHWLKKSTLKVPPIDQYIKEGDKIKIGNEELFVLETPGHTPGSICLFHSPSHNSKFVIHNSALFVGDTLFSDSIGSTDHSYSSPTNLKKSLKNLKLKIKNLKLSPVVVYPGHGESFLFSTSPSFI